MFSSVQYLGYRISAHGLQPTLEITGNSIQRGEDPTYFRLSSFHYNQDEESLLACDTSPYSIGAVLLHHSEDSQEKPINFASKAYWVAKKKIL